MYKMIVLDMDDTLLDDNQKISKRNKEAIMKAQKDGVYVVLASGRPSGAMIEYAKELEMDRYNSYIISFNGGEIISCSSGDVIFSETLNKNEIHSLYDFSREHGVQIITYKDNMIITEDEGKYIDVESNITKMLQHKVDSFKEYMDTNAVKCIMLEEPEYLKKVEGILKKEKQDKSVAISKPFFLEIMPHGIDKGKSLDRLAKILNINRKNIMAVGNAYNDLSMIEYSGLGVWVANADKELFAMGDAVVADNNNDGVAEAIERYVLSV